VCYLRSVPAYFCGLWSLLHANAMLLHILACVQMNAIFDVACMMSRGLGEDIGVLTGYKVDGMV